MSQFVHWPALALIAFAGCSFTPGALTQRDDAAMGPMDDSTLADMSMIDVDAAPDAAPDSPPPPPTQFVRLIDLDDAKITGAPHADFPVLVTITATWLRAKSSGGDVERDDGFDIFFSSDQPGATRLAHEVEAYLPAAGTLVAWVKVPTLQAATTFFLHYGSDSITTDQQNVAGVWTGAYELVMHLDVVGDATGKTTSFSAVTTAVTTGQIDQARTFDGADDRIDTGSAAAIDNIFAAGGTFEGWMNPDTFGEGGFGRLAEKSEWLLGLNNTDVTSSIGFIHSSSSSQGWWTAADNSVTLDTWQHVAIVYNKDSTANDPQFFINGVSVGITERNTPGGSMDSDASSTLYIGNRSDLQRTFAGQLDEVRLSSVSRSADWIATQYRNQSNPGAFYSISAPL